METNPFLNETHEIYLKERLSDRNAPIIVSLLILQSITNYFIIYNKLKHFYWFDFKWFKVHGLLNTRENCYTILSLKVAFYGFQSNKTPCTPPPSPCVIANRWLRLIPRPKLFFLKIGQFCFYAIFARCGIL